MFLSKLTYFKPDSFFRFFNLFFRKFQNQRNRIEIILLKYLVAPVRGERNICVCVFMGDMKKGTEKKALEKSTPI